MSRRFDGPTQPTFGMKQLVRLQRLAGNAAVSSLFAQRQDATQNLAGGPSTVTLTKPGGVDITMLGTTPTNVTGGWGS